MSAVTLFEIVGYIGIGIAGACVVAVIVLIVKINRLRLGEWFDEP